MWWTSLPLTSAAASRGITGIIRTGDENHYAPYSIQGLCVGSRCVHQVEPNNKLRDVGSLYVTCLRGDAADAESEVESSEHERNL